MIKVVSEIICCKEPPKKLLFGKELRHYSEPEAFKSKKQNNIFSFLSHFLTL